MPGPLLVLGGARDEVVPPNAHAAMLERLTADPCTEIVYPEGWHLLLRDLQRQVVWDDILAWIDGAPPPSGLAQPCGGGAQRGRSKRPGDPQRGIERAPPVLARDRDLPLAAHRRQERLDLELQRVVGGEARAARCGCPARPGTSRQHPLRAIVAAPAWKSIET